MADRLTTLIAGAQFDACGYDAAARRHLPGSSPLRSLHRVAIPGRGLVCLFKVLLTNSCVNDCAYCVNQAGRDWPRTAFQPQELARIFMELYRRRRAQGLFLTSGIMGNASRTMESMIKTLEILRHHYQYRGYIHLKIMPGASYDYVEAGCRLADRVSVNMEAPSPQHLARLTSRKNLHGDIVERMSWVKKLYVAS